MAILAWLGIRLGQGLAPADQTEPADQAAAGGAGTARQSAGSPEPGAAPAAGPLDPAEVERRAATADRLWGCLRVIEADDVDRAFEAVQVASDLDLDDAQRTRLRTAAAALESRIRDEQRAALESVRAGDVLAGVARLEPAFATSRDEVRSLLAEAFEAFGGAVPVPGPAADIPPPMPLSRGILVRARTGGGIADGQVVDARADEVTVRVRNERGLVFPTLPRTAVEPRQAGADVAVAQAVAALRAGDRLLGAAWLVRAHELGAAPERITELGAFVSR